MGYAIWDIVRNLINFLADRLEPQPFLILDPAQRFSNLVGCRVLRAIVLRK